MASWLNSRLKEFKNRLQRCVHFADKTDPFGPIKFFVMLACMTNAAEIYAGLSAETLVLPKDRDNGGPCEDLVGMHGNTFWVIDGAGTPSRWQFEGQSLTAAGLVQTINRAFMGALNLMPDIPLPGLIALARKTAQMEIKARHLNITYDQLLTGVPHAALLVVRVHKNRIECASLQDSTLLVRAGQAGAPLELRDKRQECFNAAYYSEIAKVLAAHGAQSQAYNKLLDDMVDHERKFRNQGNGFFTFTGISPVEEFAVYAVVFTGPGAKLVLTTDGASRYWDVFGLPKADMFSLSLEEIARQVRTREAQDPLAKNFPRIGVQDDIGMLRITVK